MISNKRQTAENSIETVFTAMSRLKLLGCVADGEFDLSTNPRHMEGFGCEVTATTARENGEHGCESS